VDRPIVVRKYRAKSESKAMEHMAGDGGISDLVMEHHVWTGQSLGRSIITPIILLIGGYLIGGQLGAIAGALIGIAYLIYVVAASQGTLTVTFRRR
jgi:hypothetical protein